MAMTVVFEWNDTTWYPRSMDAMNAGDSKDISLKSESLHKTCTALGCWQPECGTKACNLTPKKKRYWQRNHFKIFHAFRHHSMTRSLSQLPPRLHCHTHRRLSASCEREWWPSPDSAGSRNLWLGICDTIVILKSWKWLAQSGLSGLCTSPAATPAEVPSEAYISGNEHRLLTLWWRCRDVLWCIHVWVLLSNFDSKEVTASPVCISTPIKNAYKHMCRVLF